MTTALISLFCCFVFVFSSFCNASVISSQLRMNHVQCKGTHNSYHIASDITLVQFNYTHKNITFQLDHGIRFVEFDFRLLPDGKFYVHHADVVDPLTTCETLVNCLQLVRNWSLAHPTHTPIFILLEKINRTFTSQNWISFENTLLSVFPNNSIITPDLVRGGSATLREAVMTKGWPSLDEQRGKVLFLFDDFYTEYVAPPNTGLVNRLVFFMFHDVALQTNESAAIFSINPEGGNITSFLKNNFIIRTRADAEFYRGPFTDADIMAAYFKTIDLNRDGLIVFDEYYIFSEALLRDMTVVADIFHFVLEKCSNTNFLTMENWTCVWNIANDNFERPSTFNTTLSWRSEALESSAQFITTDYPDAPFSGADPTSNDLRSYWVNIPNTTPEYPCRCNPLTLPPGITNCLPSDIERISGSSNSNGSSRSAGSGDIIVVMVYALVVFSFLVRS